MELDPLPGRPVLTLSRPQLCLSTLGLALGLSALAAGAVHLVILAPCALLVIVSGLLAVGVGRGDTSAAAFDRGALLCIGASFALAGICLLQCLPLPMAALERVAPDNADVWSRALRPFNGVSLTLASISLAPQRSVIEALKGASYGLIFAISVRLGRTLGMRAIATLAFTVAMAVALVTAGHQMTGAKQVYGIYQPIDAYSIAPLLNANTRAGYLNLGFFCGLGLLLRAGARPHAALLGLGLTFLVAEILLCESLGGTGCLAAGTLLAILLAPQSSHSARRIEWGRLTQAGIVTSIGVGAAMLALTARRTKLGLGDRSVEKLDLFEKSWQLARDHFALGVGRGAFGSTFSAYQNTGRHVISEHAENFPLQWAAEWGVPVTLLALGVFTWALAPILIRRSSSEATRRCAAVGCGAVLLQNLVDLGLELPAVSALLCCVLGSLLGTSSAQGASGIAARRILWPASAFTGFCLVLAVVFGAPSPSRLRHELHTQLAATSGPPSASFWSELRRATLSYPAEPYFALLGSFAALAAGQDAIPWISRALERNPASAQTHLQLARILQARHATSQALGALRRAVELDPRQARTVLDLGAAWKLSPEAMVAAVPDGTLGAPMLAMLASQSQESQLRLRLLERSVERDPSLANVHHQLATELLRDLSQKSAGSACAERRETCLELATKHAKLGSLPEDSRTAILESRILYERGQRREAEDYLARECEKFSGDVKCTGALVDLAFGNASARLPGAVKVLLAAACSDRERCGAAHLRLGHKFAQAKQWNVALGHYQHAVQELPSSEAWQSLARAAEELGQEELSKQALRRVRLLEAASGNSPSFPTPSGADDIIPLPAPDDLLPVQEGPPTEHGGND